MPSRYPVEVSKRAVRLVLEHREEFSNSVGGGLVYRAEVWLFSFDIAGLGAPG
jgi:hypothetical protein